MVSFIFTYSLVSTLVASTIAGPVAVHIPSAPFVLVERIPSIPLGSYDLTTSHVDDVLFNMCVIFNPLRRQILITLVARESLLPKLVMPTISSSNV